MHACLPCSHLQLPSANQGMPGPSLSAFGGASGLFQMQVMVAHSCYMELWWNSFVFLSWLVLTDCHHRELGFWGRIHSLPEGVGLNLKVTLWDPRGLLPLAPGGKKLCSQPRVGETRNTSTSSIYWACCKRPWRIHNFYPDPQVTLAPLFLLVKPQLPGQQQLVQKSNFSLHTQGAFVSF